MNRVFSKIKHLIGVPVMVQPIVDTFNYQRNSLSFSGNSLSEDNILIITNIIGGYEEIECIFKNENCNLNILHCDNYALDIEKIKNSSAVFSAPYTHIINLLILDNDLEFKFRVTKIDDPLRIVYQWLQVESDYFIEMKACATICTAYYYDDFISDIEIKAQKGGISSLIKGLGGVMSKHSIIENGVIASTNVPFSEMLNTVIYLSGKYGQIMAGAVLQMDFINRVI